jgi:hypothetical protein
MKNTRRFCAAVVLALVFSLTALGGDMYGGIAPPNPAPTPASATADATEPTTTTAQQQEENDLSAATLAEAAAQLLSLVLTIL